MSRRLFLAAASTAYLGFIIASGCESADETASVSVSSTGGAGGIGGAGGSAGGCSEPSDCGTDTDCRSFECSDGSCETVDAPLGTTCDEGGEVCDGRGQCVPASCVDTVQNADETDVDCGGSCPDCANDKNCLEGDDCDSGFCDNGGAGGSGGAGGGAGGGATGTCQPCDVDGQCNATGNLWCDAGKCVPAGTIGDDCTSDNECASDHCADGKCCDTACAGGCDVCSVAAGSSTDGSCEVLAAASPGDPSCAPYLCDGTSADCPTTCTGNTDCISSVSCAQGFCCDQPCTGTCQSCAAAETGGTDGICGDVQAGTDPQSDCGAGSVCDGNGVCKKENGEVCAGDSECLNAHCVDGACCDTACGGGATGDCQACNLAALEGTCSPVALNTQCRASAGPCDVAEVCNGVALTCPADGYAGTSTTCRASAGVCDAAEHCTGSSAACPNDVKLGTSTVCRASAGACDLGEVCDGMNDNCPADAKVASGTTCRASAGVCDVAETCNGVANACPADVFASASVVCRADGGACDVADTCTGSSAACPADAKEPVTTVCRASAGVCDVAENCDGANNACPADGFSTAVCRASVGLCDAAESCSGSSPACPADGKLSAGTQCRAQSDVCDVAESCDGSSNNCPADAKVIAGTQCRAAGGVCDLAESCDGSSSNCPADAFVVAGTECRADGGICDVAEACTGSSAACPADAKEPITTQCRAALGICDATESCDGLTNNCPADAMAPAGTACRASAGICDADESCTGLDANCPADAKVVAGTPCRGAAGSCDVVENCDGTANDCPIDGFFPAGTECRASSGTCDPNETCAGGTPACPSNGFAPQGTPCSEGGGHVCNSGGSCVQCNVNGDCAALGGGACLAGVCQAPSCADTIENGTETDVDCGGGACPACSLGQGCSIDTDCKTGNCLGSVCQPVEVIAVSPADGATNATPYDRVVVTFSGPMTPATLTLKSTFTDTTCTGSLQVSTDDFATCIPFATAAPTMSGGDMIATAKPLLTLAYGATFKVRVTTAAHDAQGSPITAFTMATGFKTLVDPFGVVISTIYGGGGNAGATWRNDFVELHNRGGVAVDLTGWAIRYGSSGGNTWNELTVLNGSIAAGGYYLVQLATGGLNGAFLPSPDATGTTNMSATAGKVALLRSNVALASTSCPASADLVDFVGYGSANCFETSSTAAPSATLAAVRSTSGCRDTGINSADFTATATFTPRNSASSPVACAPLILNESEAPSEPDYCSVQFPLTITQPAGTTVDVFGQLYEAGFTDTVPAPVAGFIAQFGFGPRYSNPQTQSGWFWMSAPFNAEFGNNDEYWVDNFVVPPIGTYSYAFRMSLDNGATWSYCDVDGAGSNVLLSFDVTQVGIMTSN